MSIAEKMASNHKQIAISEFFEKNKTGQEEMIFDYVMRQGVSPTTNALKLLELAGLTGFRQVDS